MGANELTWPRGFQIGVTLDALLAFVKSGGLRGHLKEVSGGWGGNQMSNVILMGANELPWLRGFQIGVTLDALLVFVKSGGFKGPP